MSTIERKAKDAYFAQDRSKRCGLSLYTDGYKDGFLQAMNEVMDCLNQSNNKVRIDSIRSLVYKYGNENRNMREM